MSELLLVGDGEQKTAVVVAGEAQPGLEGVDAAECGAAFFLGGGGPFLVGGGVSGVSRVGGVVVFVRGVDDVVCLRNLQPARRGIAASRRAMVAASGPLTGARRPLAV